MKKGIMYFISFSVCMMLVACFDLGPLLFNPETDITEYLWDENPRNDYFDEDGLYDILEGELNYFTLESDLDGEVETIHAVYLGDLESISSDTVIVFSHGNAANMDAYFPWAQMLYNAGGKSRFGVLMMDYRGFGLSTGTPSESALMADVNTCLDWLKGMGLSDDRLILYGFSLGSIPSVYLSASPISMVPEKLMLESPVGSISTMSTNASGLSMPASFFADLDTDNIEEIKKVKQDLYWIHGQSDNFLNYYTHGEAIFNNHGGDYKVAVPVRYGGHGDAAFKFGVEKYMESISDFLIR